MPGLVQPPGFLRSQLNAYGRGLTDRQIPISNRNFWCQNGIGSASNTTTIASYFGPASAAGTFRTAHYFPTAFTNLRCLFVNTSQDPGASATSGAETPPWANSDLSAPLPIIAYVEYVTAGVAVSRPLYFHGQSTITLAEGGMALSDPVQWHFDPSVQNHFWIRTYLALTPGQYFPVMKEAYGVDLEGWADGTNIAANTGSAGFTTSGMNLYGPLVCYGTPATPNQVVLGAWGDSIMAGAKNNFVNGVQQGAATFAPGFSWLDYLNCGTTVPSPSLSNPTYPLVKLSRSSAIAQAESESTTSNNAIYHGKRFLMLNGCSHCFIAIGRNDFNNSATLANVQTWVTKMCNYALLDGVIPILCTLCPDTTSTDSWATATNQTPTTWESNRTAYNNWVRAGGPGSPVITYDPYACIEVNSSNVLTVNGGRWLSNGTAQHFVNDGIHPANGGNVYIAANNTLPALAV